jgi:cytoskeleton protein RodZ
MFEIGSSLREARLRQGLDFPEIEQTTKIRAKYLRALEDEQFDLLPAQTYVKGFLRNYAEYLGLDGQLYVDEFNSRYVVGDDEVPARPRRSPPARSTPRVQSRALVLALVGIALVATLVIVAWKAGNPQHQAIQGLGSTSTSQAPASSVTPQTKPHHRATAARLQVTAVLDATWLQVHRGSATGPLVFQGTLEKGQRQLFVGRRLWVDVSRPEVVTATLNGRSVRIPTGGVKTLVVTPRGIRPATGA